MALVILDINISASWVICTGRAAIAAAGRLTGLISDGDIVSAIMVLYAGISARIDWCSRASLVTRFLLDFDFGWISLFAHIYLTFYFRQGDCLML